jgi:diketogulonate reductase-like aldo/keto reductase
MEYKRLSDGTKIPVLGIGTYGMGGLRERDPSNIQESITAIKKGIELGMTHIDTAELYGQGLTEEIVGQAIEEYDRKNLVISTKFWIHNNADEIVAAVKQSLNRMKITYVDICIAHRPMENLAELALALDKLVELKLTKYIGVSNFSIEQLKTLYALTKHKISFLQTEYNLSNQKAKREYFDFCEAHDIMIIAHRPLALGKLSEGNNPLIEDLVTKYNKTPVQIALRWLIQQKNVVAIPRTLNPAHMTENLGGIGWNINEEDMKNLFAYIN